LCALVVLPVPFALSMSSYWSAALLVGLALAGHQGFSTNVFSLTGDLFPRAFVASVVGIGALFGNLGGFLMLETTGRVLQATNSYLPLFLYCAGAYLVAWVLIRTLVPSFRDA
jgi:ACS family hexuronate transporter-like MFS transporter